MTRLTFRCEIVGADFLMQEVMLGQVEETEGECWVDLVDWCRLGKKVIVVIKLLDEEQPQ